MANYPAENATRNKWINGLDSLRFILALIVVLSHSENPLANDLRNSSILLFKSLGSLISVSFCGVGAVIAFFIISGFVIHLPNKNGISNTKRFLTRRWLRIGLPLVVVSMVAILFDSFGEIPIWSLYCELFYYTIYPLLVKIKLSWEVKTLLSFIISGALIGALSFTEIQSLYHQSNIQYDGNYWLLGAWLTCIVGLPCWLLGVVLAQHIEDEVKSISSLKINVFRFLIWIIATLAVIARFHFYVSYIISMNLFALLLYHWIKYEIFYFRNHPTSKFLEYLGKFSYSIYLCHGLSLTLIFYLLPRNFFTYLVSVILTIALSYLFFLLVEKPSHKLAVYAAKKLQ